jgi:hypothetical protein
MAGHSPERGTLEAGGVRRIERAEQMRVELAMDSEEMHLDELS